MTYGITYRAQFLNRPNRFIAEVLLDGKPVVVHVKNTGRCKELLIPGANVVLHKAVNPNRSTGYDLIAVWKGERLINLDSYAPNRAFHEYLKLGSFIKDITFIKPEAKYASSRFDFYVEAGDRKIFIEVKGVTLEENGVVLFPDAPTLRGVKHLNELVNCLGEGFEAYAVFVVQMKNVNYFAPNHNTHPEFGIALKQAAAAGVKISALDCFVTENEMLIGDAVPVRLTD